MRALSVLIKKEFLQFLRNPFLWRMILIFPMLIMLIFPWVTTMDVRHIGVVVVDSDNSSLTRLIISKINNSDNFLSEGVVRSYERAFEVLEKGKADVILSLPEDLESSLLSGSPKRVSIDANAVNATKGSIGSSYLTGIVISAERSYLDSKGISVDIPSVAVKNMYNPTLEYRNVMIPALMIILLILTCGFLPALNIVTEKESGTIEQINVTPVSQFVFILAKLIPYWLIGFVVLTISIGVAWLVYGLAPAGSFLAIYLAALLFLLVMSGFGVLCANFSSTMLQAIFVIFFFVLIFMLMSGLLTPVSSMPGWAQDIAMFLPPKYFINIMRSVYLKGATVADLWPNYLALGIFAAFFDLAAALSYRKRS